jgi:type II secretion system protein G
MNEETTKIFTGRLLRVFSRLVERLGRVRRDERGFTLIELLVVVAIIGILVAIALPQFIRQTDKARIGQAKAELGMMRSVLEIAYNEDGSYPSNVEDIRSKLTEGGARITDDPWGRDYLVMEGSSDTFKIYSKGPDETNTGDEIVATPDGIEAGRTESGGSPL